MTKLRNAVIRQLGYEPSKMSKENREELRSTLQDVYNHGGAGGVHGFIYTVHCSQFLRRNRNDIIELLLEDADSLGEDPLVMVTGFDLVKGCEATTLDVARALFTDKEFDVRGTIVTCLSIYALEHVARAEMAGAENA